MASKFTTEYFIERSQKIHGPDKYDYSKVVYVNTGVKVEIVCKEHGAWFQTPNNHLNGQGCLECGIIKSIKSRRKTKIDFIKEANIVFGENIYDYSHVEYQNNRKKIKIICKLHGEWETTPKHHLRGQGCPACGIIKRSRGQMLSKEKLIEKSQHIYGNIYDFSESKYNGTKESIKIICQHHGAFFKTPSQLLYKKSGCPLCSPKSKGEYRVATYLKSSGINFKVQKTFSNLFSVKNLRFDFYLPSYNVLIEYDGEQHFRTVNADFFGGEKSLKERQHRDQIKTDWAAENGYKLIRIPYWDFDNIEQILNRELLGIEPEFVPHQLALF